MKAAIFTFQAANASSIIASTHLALWLGQILGLPVIDNETVCDTTWDVLIIVNGAFAFCKHLEPLSSAIINAGRIIWVQQDYTIAPPKPVSKAESPFRFAFALRHRDGKPGIDYWTTVRANATATKNSVYINWNALTYTPLPTGLREQTKRSLLYYGAFRQGRVDSFDRVFIEPTVPITISSSRAGQAKFKNSYPNCEVVHIGRERFLETLAGYGLGLYIEDKRSHTQFHSPANRFYEMLSAGLPIVFEPASAPMLIEAGFDVSPFVFAQPEDLPTMMRNRNQIGERQRKMWCGVDYRSDLTKSAKAAWKRYIKTL